MLIVKRLGLVLETGIGDWDLELGLWTREWGIG